MKKKITLWLLTLCLLAETVMTGTAVLAADYPGDDSLEAYAAFETPEAVYDDDDELETETATSEEQDNKKAGKYDKYIGLSEDYLVVAIARQRVRVYQSMDLKSKEIGHFTKNNCIVINTTRMHKGRDYPWLKVYLKNKRRGYILSSQVKLDILNVKDFGIKSLTKKNQQRIKICQFGLPYLGTRFRLGGKSLTKGIDCSTFARTALRNAGVMVSSSATARVLVKCGKGITRAQLKPGDLLFYYHNAKDHTIAHVAIYIGDGYIINASGAQGHHYPAGGIRISRIDYRRPTAVRFRNLVGN